MVGIRVILILLVIRDVVSMRCLSNEAKKDFDESRQSLADMKKHLGKTIAGIEKKFQKITSTLNNQLGNIKKDLNTVGTKVTKVDKDFQVLGKDFQKTKWHKYNGHCYYYSQDNDIQDWFTSEKKCRDIGGYIIKIDNKKELKSVVDHRRNSGHNYWIGLAEVDEGHFRWSFDQTKLTLSNWYPGYGKKGTSENCVLLTGKRSDWFDANCSRKHPYICESNFCF